MHARFTFSYSSALALFLLACSVAFSAPVRRLAALVTNDGIFDKALQLADITDPTSYAAKVANELSSDPSICAPVQQLVQALIAGESDPTGVNSIGDRAIVGARKLLGFQDAGDSGLVDMLNDLATGNYTTNVKTALQQAVQNPPKTLASLQTYKYLVDAQAALQDLSTLVGQVGGNSSIVTAVSTILPSLQQVEAIIDKIGADFSVQNLLDQNVDIQNVLATLNSTSTNVTTLPDFNRALQTSITTATKTATDAMTALASSAASAASIAASSTPVIADSVFEEHPGPGTACS